MNPVSHTIVGRMNPPPVAGQTDGAPAWVRRAQFQLAPKPQQALAQLVAGTGGRGGIGTPPSSGSPAKPAGGGGGGGRRTSGRSQKEIFKAAGLPVVAGTKPGIGKVDGIKKELVKEGLAEKHGSSIKLKGKVWVRGTPELAQRSYDKFKELRGVLEELEKNGRLKEVTVEQFVPAAYIIDVIFSSERSEKGVTLKKVSIYSHRRQNGGAAGNGSALQIINIRDQLIDLTMNAARAIDLEGDGIAKLLTASEAGPFYVMKVREIEKTQVPAETRPIWQRIEDYLPLPKDTKKVPDELKTILKGIISLPDDQGGDDAEKYLEGVPETWEQSLRELSYLFQKEEEDHLARFVEEWWVRRFRPDLIETLAPKELADDGTGNEGA